MADYDIDARAREIVQAWITSGPYGGSPFGPSWSDIESLTSLLFRNDIAAAMREVAERAAKIAEQSSPSKPWSGPRPLSSYTQEVRRQYEYKSTLAVGAKNAATTIRREFGLEKNAP